jgi:thiol-disulfide isomerase/thioredoxin
MLIESKSLEETEKAIREHEKILLEISSPTCVPCLVFKEKAKMLIGKYPEINVVVAYDPSVPEEIYKKYFHGGHPTFIFFENGEVKDVQYGYTNNISSLSYLDELILEGYFKIMRAFLMDFKSDIYEFAREGDMIYEYGETDQNIKMITIQNKIYKLGQVWSDEENGNELNIKIAPRKVGFTKEKMTKWKILEIKEV